MNGGGVLGKGSDADARAHLDLVAVDTHRLRQRLPDRLGELEGAVDPAGSFGDDGKFVTAQPRGEDCGTRPGLEPAGDALEQAVADAMTERVVHLLEAVEVDEEQAAALLAPVAAPRLEGLLQPVEEGGAVGEARERVGRGERLQLLLGLAPGADVADDAAEHEAVRFLPARIGDLGGEGGAVGPKAGELGLALEAEIRAALAGLRHPPDEAGAGFLGKEPGLRLADDRLGRVAEDARRRVVPEDDPAAVVGADHRIGRGRRDLEEARPGVLLGRHQPPLLEIVDDEGGEVGEHLALVVGERGPRCDVEDAERADRLAGRDRERCPGIETDMRRAGDERVRGEAGVVAGVRDDEDFVGENGMGAEGVAALELGQVDAAPRLEPDPVGVDEGEEGDRHLEERGGEMGKAVVFRLRPRSGDLVRPEELETLRLIVRDGELLQAHGPHPAKGIVDHGTEALPPNEGFRTI